MNDDYEVQKHWQLARLNHGDAKELGFSIAFVTGTAVALVLVVLLMAVILQ